MDTRYLLGEKQIPTHWYNIKVRESLGRLPKVAL